MRRSLHNFRKSLRLFFLCATCISLADSKIQSINCAVTLPEGASAFPQRVAQCRHEDVADVTYIKKIVKPIFQSIDFLKVKSIDQLEIHYYLYSGYLNKVHTNI